MGAVLGESFLVAWRREMRVKLGALKREMEIDQNHEFCLGAMSGSCSICRAAIERGSAILRLESRLERIWVRTQVIKLRAVRAEL